MNYLNGAPEAEEDVLGIVTAARERREKHARYAYRAPWITETRRPAVIDKEMAASIAELRRENVDLRREVMALRAEIALMRLPRRTRQITIAEVQDVFCTAMNAADYRVDGGATFSINHMKSPRRGRLLAWPRQVCMWLCRELSQEPSLAMIGKCFGGRDHTTCIHANKRGPEIIAESEMFRGIAESVMAHFKGPTS